MNKEIKNKTLLHLEELRKQKETVSKELVIWTEKEQKANEFLQVLEETRRFTMQYLNDNIKKVRDKLKQSGSLDYYLLEGEIRDKVEFNVYYQGLDLFEEKIKENIENQREEIQRKLWSIESEIEKLEKRETQRELKKQNKVITKTQTLTNHD